MLISDAIQLTNKKNYVNYCRLYLNVISIADIAEENGYYILAEVYNRIFTNSTNQNLICNQTNPSTTIWTPWRKLLCRITLPNRRKLRQPLGKWIVPPNEILKEYPTYCDEQYIYQRHKEGFTKQRFDSRHRVTGNNRQQIL